MRRTILTTSLLVILTLSLTQLATAQWKNNVFKNESSGNVYVAFTTYRPATDDIPLGWRTTAWYEIEPGESHIFQAFGDNAIYYLIYQASTRSFIKPENAKTFRAWRYTPAFKIVSEDEPDTFTPSADLLYAEPRERATIQGSSDYFKSANTGSVTVTPRGVIAPLAEILPPPPRESIAINISTASGSTTLNQGSTTQLTILVTENGDPTAGKAISLNVTGNKATISPAIGVTDSDGELAATLTINRNATPGTFTVTATISNTEHSKALPITVKVGAGQVSISSSPSTIQPGQTSRVTFTVRTPGGAPFPNAKLSLSASVGNIQPTLVTTGTNGQVTATYRADQYTGTPSPRTISTPTITATVVDNPTVKGTARLTVGYVLGSFSVSGVPRSITSGESRTITVTVRSRSNTPLSGVRVTIVEGDDSEIAFSSLSGNTNSSGQWRTTMRTGNKGQAEFSVKVSGLPTQVLPNGTNSLTVNPEIWEWERSGGRHHAGCGGGKWIKNTKRFVFPGTVTWYTWRSQFSKSEGTADLRITDDRKSGNTVYVTYQLWRDWCLNGWQNYGEIWVKAKYEKTAPTPSGYGAPSLHSQTYEQDLSLVAAHPQMQLPAETALLPNYPNPFNPETWIPYHLSAPAEVTLSIYSADGQLVRTLALGHQDAGIYESKSRAAYWDGRNSVGEHVASGLYFYTLTAGDFAATDKMLIMK